MDNDLKTYNDKKEVAKEAYRQIVKAICKMEEDYNLDNVYYELPRFIDVDDNRFYRYQLLSCD